MLGVWLFDSLTTPKEGNVKYDYIQQLTFKADSSYSLYTSAYDILNTIEGKYTLIRNPENKAKTLLMLMPQYTITNANDTIRQYHIYTILNVTINNLIIRKESQIFGDSLPLVIYNRSESYRKKK